MAGRVLPRQRLDVAAHAGRHERVPGGGQGHGPRPAETLPLRRAALAEPLAVALHALAVAGGVAGKKVLVSGSGPIGLLAAAAALAKGATEVVVTDVLPGPLERARALGVHGTVQVGVEEIPAAAFDVVLECSASPPRSARPWSVPGEPASSSRSGWCPTRPGRSTSPRSCPRSSSCAGRSASTTRSTRRWRSSTPHRPIDEVITHTLPAGRALEAFATARDSERSGKVLVSLWRDRRSEQPVLTTARTPRRRPRRRPVGLGSGPRMVPVAVWRTSAPSRRARVKAERRTPGSPGTSEPGADPVEVGPVLRGAARRLAHDRRARLRTTAASSSGSIWP